MQVPLSFAHELYALRQHLELLMQQIVQRLSETTPHRQEELEHP